MTIMKECLNYDSNNAVKMFVKGNTYVVRSYGNSLVIAEFETNNESEADAKYLSEIEELKVL